MRYIEKINAEEGGQLITPGTHWPIKTYTTTPATSPAPQEESTQVAQPELKKPICPMLANTSRL
jgi:hypothetical protein